MFKKNPLASCKFLLRTFIFGAFISVFLANGLFAQTTASPKRLRDVLSSDAMIYVDAPDFQSTMKRGSDIPSARILREEEFQEFLSPLFKLARTEIDKMLVKIGEKPENWQKCPIKSIEFAYGAPIGETAPAVIVKIDSAQVCELLRKMIQKPDYKMFLQVTDSNGIQIVTFPLAPNMAAGLQGDTIIFAAAKTESESTGPEIVQLVQKSLKGEVQKGSLAADAEFTNLLGKLQSKQPEWVAFARPAKFAQDMYASLMGQMPTAVASRPARRPRGGDAMAIEIVQLLGGIATELKLDQMTGVMFAESYSNGGVTTETAALISTNSPLIAAFIGNGKPVDRAFLDKAIDGVDGFSTFNVDVTQLYKAVGNGMNKHFTGDRASDNPFKYIAEYEKENGISIESDLLSQLGPEYYSYSFPPKAGAGPVPTWDSFYVLRVREKAKVEKTIAAFAKSLNSMKAKIAVEVSDPTPTRPAVYTLKLAEDAGGGNPAFAMVANQIGISLALLDDWLVISTNPVALKNELRNMKKPRDASADVKKYLSTLPAEASTLTFNDWRPVVRTLWDTMASFVGVAAGRMQAIPVDLQKIPTSQSIVKNMKPSSGFWMLTKDGIYGRSSGNFGLELYSSVFAGAVGASLYFQTSRMAFAGPPPDDEPDDTTTVTSKPAAGQKQVATGDDRVMKAKDMLLRLEAGARIYKNDSGKLPGNLQILLKSNDDHPQGYLPGLKEIPKDPWGSDYFYEVTEDGKTFHLRSFGANAKDDGGAGDDIKSDS